MVLEDNIYNINIIHGLVVNWHYQISTSQLHLSYNSAVMHEKRVCVNLCYWIKHELVHNGKS